MESPFAQLYLDLEKHILREVKAIRQVAINIGQMEMYNPEDATSRPPLSFPAVLVDFVDTGYSQLSELVQWADFAVQIKLCFTPFSSASSITPDVSKEKALEYFEIENKLYKALAGYTADNNIQPMMRIACSTEQREDFYRCRIMIFTTGGEDAEAQRPVNMKEADLDITSEFTS